MRTLMGLLAVAILIGSVVGASWMLNHSPATTGTLPSAEAEKDLPPMIIAFGEIDVEPGVAQLYPEQQGRIVDLIAEGVKVAKGDVLLEVDGALARTQVAMADAALLAAQRELEEAKSLPQKHQLDIKQQVANIEAMKHKRESIDADLKNKQELLKSNIGATSKLLVTSIEESRKQMDEAIKAEDAKLEQLKLLNPQLKIDQAQANVTVKEAERDRAKIALEKCKLRAPDDGLVLRVLAHKGEVLGPNPSAPAIQFAPDAPKIVRAEVMQEWGHKVHLGQKCVIEDDTYKGPRWEGKVRSMAEVYGPKRKRIIEPFMLNDVRTLECIVAFTTPQPAVRIGQRVRVKIEIN
jgi:multidrug resistance efflux pump